jgi:hypothetical protein
VLGIAQGPQIAAAGLFDLLDLGDIAVRLHSHTKRPAFCHVLDVGMPTDKVHSPRRQSTLD